MEITPNDRKNLIEKQGILNKISLLESQVANIPEQLEIDKLKAIDSDDTKIIVNSDIHDLRVEIQRYKSDLDKVNSDKNANNEKLATQTLSGNNINNINSDIERQSKRQQELKRKILEIEEDISSKEKQIVELDNTIVENDKKITTLENEVKEKSENNLKEISKLKNEYENIILDPDLEELFQIRLSSGIAVATLDENNMCSACQMIQPPAVASKIKNANSNELLFCEECDRILLK